MDGSLRLCRTSKSSKSLRMCRFMGFANYGTMVVQDTGSGENIMIDEDWWDMGSIERTKKALEARKAVNLEIPFSVSTSESVKKPEPVNHLITEKDSVEDFIPEQLDSHTKFYDDFELISQ